MNKEQYRQKQDEERKRLLKDFPHLFKKVTNPIWALSVPHGWLPMVRALCSFCSGLQADVDIIQIKQKMGRLTIYMDNETEIIHGYRLGMEAWAAQTCQVCGGPGSFRILGGYRCVMCLDCAQEREEIRD